MLFFYQQGKRFVLRDQLRQADTILVVAGTRGNIAFLDGKIATAVALYKAGWASCIIGSGKCSMKVTETFSPLPLEELQAAATQGRIEEKDVRRAYETWDTRLGANYIREKALAMGVPDTHLLTDEESLHTRENAENVLGLLREHHMRRVILVTSPFHQLRTYLTFAKVFEPHDIEILNYYADADDWHPLTWFLSKKHRDLVRSEQQRILLYREKGDLL